MNFKDKSEVIRKFTSTVHDQTNGDRIRDSNFYWRSLMTKIKNMDALSGLKKQCVIDWNGIKRQMMQPYDGNLIGYGNYKAGNDVNCYNVVENKNPYTLNFNTYNEKPFYNDYNYLNNGNLAYENQGYIYGQNEIYSGNENCDQSYLMSDYGPMNYAYNVMQENYDGYVPQYNAYSGRSKRDNAKTFCEHCETTETSLWRKQDDRIVCNACGLYYKMHGIKRPNSLRKNGIRKRRRSRKNDGINIMKFNQ